MSECVLCGVVCVRARLTTNSRVGRLWFDAVSVRGFVGGGGSFLTCAQFAGRSSEHVTFVRFGHFPSATERLVERFGGVEHVAHGGNPGDGDEMHAG